MPLLGAHLSIKGGFHKAVESAAAMGMDSVQMFTGSPQMWPVPPVTTIARAKRRAGSATDPRRLAPAIAADDARLFAQAIAATGIRMSLAHNCYLINLASPQPAIWRRSIDALVLEVQRCEALGLAYLVAHPGCHMENTVEQGIERIATALDEVHGQTRGARVQLLLEVTAGQGTSLGHRFEQLAEILHLARDPERLGICLDTCHAFAAGYPLSTRRQYESTMDELDRTVGLSLVRAVHLNDSKRELGSRVDRHEHIGRGHLGLSAFRYLLNDRRFRGIPMCLETPKGVENGQDLDVMNLSTLRRLIKRNA